MRFLEDLRAWSSSSDFAARQLEIFRNRHRPGQKVKGRIVGYQGSKMAWVRIQGLDLLAQVYSRPVENQEVVFRIERLQPQVVLKEQSTDSSGVNLYI
jgi:hypothetical protein